MKKGYIQGKGYVLTPPRYVAVIGATSGYIAAMVSGIILLGLAFCASLLIPKPGEQK